MEKKLKSIQIETIQGCTLHCSFCPNSKIDYTMKLMSKKLYHSIIDQLKEMDFTGRVSPFLMNEPLLDKRLVSLVEYTCK